MAFAKIALATDHVRSSNKPETWNIGGFITVPVVLIATALAFVGLPGLMPLPWWQTLVIFVYAMVSCLVVNDALKVAMIKWRVPAAVA